MGARTRAHYDPEPAYSEQAHAAKYQETIVLEVIIDAGRKTLDIRFGRTLGFGLDEKAIDAVRTRRFQPAREGGRLVAVLMNIAVTSGLH